MASSDHFDGKHFFNPSGPALQPFSAAPRMLLSRRTPWPRQIDQPLTTPPLGGANLVVTFVGHSTFLIQTPAGTLITDPVFADHAGPWGRLGPRRVRRLAVALADLPRIDVILLSHNHYDHCDLGALRALRRRFNPLAITPLGNAPLLRKAGLTRVHELDWWQETAATD